MSERPGRSTGCTVLVCRGCCCGTERKHPDVDHAAQLAALEAAVVGVPGGRVRVVDCLDECSRSNVVVVRDRATGTRVWLGEVNEAAVTDALADWLAAWETTGGALPAALAAHAFVPATAPADVPVALVQLDR